MKANLYPMGKAITLFFVVSCLFSCSRGIVLKQVESENLKVEWAEVKLFDHFPQRMYYSWSQDSIVSKNMTLFELFKNLTEINPGIADFQNVEVKNPYSDYDINIYLKENSERERISEVFPELLKLLEKENLIEISK